MNNEFRYILGNGGKKKHYCPNCNKKRFVRYIDTVTGEFLPERYGRCDREIKCGYFLNPYKDGYALEIWKRERGEGNKNWKPKKLRQIKKSIPAKLVYFPTDIFKQTRSGYEQNVFIQNLLNRVDYPFDIKEVERVISTYHLGTVTNGYRKGAITFPFIDITGGVRTIQVKQFDEQNHTIATDFLHSMIEKHYLRKNKSLPQWLVEYNNNEVKVSCLFGEHLLGKYPHNPVGLVEAPKTAIYCTLYLGFPEKPKDLIWLAVYNLSSLNFEKCKPLQGRNVFLFPDTSENGRAFKLWNDRAEQIQKRLTGTKFYVSNLLEKLAPKEDKKQGKDIADYLIKQNWRNFRKQRELSAVKNLTKLNIIDDSIEQFEIEEPEDWRKEITELEKFFNNVKLPTSTLKLNQYCTIIDCSVFIENHISVIKTNNGKRTFRPYLTRLQELKKILK